jgi:hypothetical protein
MPQFDAASIVTSNPYCVNGKEFLSRICELLGDMRDRGREASPARQRARTRDILRLQGRGPRGRAGQPDRGGLTSSLKSKFYYRTGIRTCETFALSEGQAYSW